MSTNDELIDYVESLTPQEQAQALAVLKNIQEHIKPLERVLRDTYVDTHSDADHPIVTIDGEKVAELSMTRGGVGGYVVKDKEAYGAVLHDVEAELDGGYPAVEEKWMPRDEACTSKYIEGLLRNGYLDDLIRDNDGELPGFIACKKGRAATVTVKLANRGGFPLTLAQLKQTALFKEIEG